MSEKTISLTDQAYETIKKNILNLTYQPGSPLTETMLAKELGMSRSPIRSAIHMLLAEGLIVTDYYKSIRVKEITEKDILELYQLREFLEGEAFRTIFATNRQEEFSYRIEEKVVRMCAAAQDIYQWELADAAMHMEIVSALENDRINKIYETNLAELIRIGVSSVKNGMIITQTNDNLKTMVQLMRDGNYEASYDILKKDHFGIGKDRALLK